MFYSYLFKRIPNKLASALLDSKNHSEDYYLWRDSAMIRLEQKPCIKMTMLSPRGYFLKGFYYPCGEEPCGRIAFIVHGFRSNHSETAGVWYDYYTSRGFDVFCADNPAHGESEGEFVSFDYLEAEAALAWIDNLKLAFGSGIQIILQGFSLGGGTVMLMSDRVPENVKFIIDDCGFLSAEALLRPQVGPLYEPFRILNAFLGRFNLKRTDVLPHLRRSNIPMLFVHGRKDPTVPFWMGEKCYEVCPGEKDCLWVDDAAHMEVWYLKPAEYAEKIERYISLYIN